MGSDSERQPAGEEADPHVWIPFLFKAALTVHFYLISPGRQRKVPVGSGCEGKTTWPWFALGSAPSLPSPGERVRSQASAWGVHKTQGRESPPDPFGSAFGTQAPPDGGAQLSKRTFHSAGLTGRGRRAVSSLLLSPWLGTASPLRPTRRTASPRLHPSKILPLWPRFLKQSWRDVDQVLLFFRGLWKGKQSTPWVMSNLWSVRGERGGKNHFRCLKMSCKWCAAFQYSQTPFFRSWAVWRSACVH